MYERLEVGEGGVLRNQRRNLVDKVGGVVAENMGGKDFAVRSGEDFKHAVACALCHGFAVGGIAGFVAGERRATFFKMLLGGAYDRQFGMREDDRRRAVGGIRLRCRPFLGRGIVEQVVEGEISLPRGSVRQEQAAVDIAGGINAFYVGL